MKICWNTNDQEEGKNEFMNEEILQNMSRELTHPVFRNGIVEELHSEGRCLNNETMKILNKDINNRMYTICLHVLAEMK